MRRYIAQILAGMMVLMLGVIGVLAQDVQPPTDNLLETIVNYSEQSTLQQRDKLDTFIGALETANIHTLLESGEYTVFAPTNGGFDTLFQREGIGESELLNSEALATVLAYHILPGRLTFDDFAEMSEVRNDAVAYVTTLGGMQLKVQVDRTEHTMRIADGQASIFVEDIQATNGVVHVIDNVLVPAEDVSLASVVPVDVNAPFITYTEGTIADILANNAEFSVLLAALEAKGLTGRLQAADANVTLFAPTNAAMEKLLVALNMDMGTLAGTDFLESVLAYHVAEGVYAADGLKPGGGASALPSAEGSLILLTLDGDEVVLNSVVRLVQTDVTATNGTIHVIDGVLLPSVK